MTGQTALLWAVPVLVLIAGGVGAFLAMRRHGAAFEPLTDEERRRLASLGENEA
jgi:cytochrome c-type biogenesis protein CcmH/NrfF